MSPEGPARMIARALLRVAAEPKGTGRVRRFGPCGRSRVSLFSGFEQVPARLTTDSLKTLFSIAGFVPASASLSASAAPEWLRLQQQHAWKPEIIGPELRKGRSPQDLAKPLPRESEIVARLERISASLVPLTHSAYPEALSVLEDAPLVLGLRGSAAVLSTDSIGIVGARAATREARSHARRLGRELASAGMTIVSGLARGIDAEAHRGALEAGGRTVGVLACGIDRVYPPEHRDLAEEITRNGAIVSELPPGTPPRRIHFPLRNRIISGLSLGVIVVEARSRSGSLITVRHALAQGRDVFVMPGAVSGPFAEGTNQLLRDGARLIRGAEDVLEDLGRHTQPAAAGGTPETRRAASEERRASDPLAVRVLAALAPGPLSRELLLVESGLAAADLGRILFELQLSGMVEEERDGRVYLRAQSSRSPKSSTSSVAPRGG